MNAKRVIIGLLILILIGGVITVVVRALGAMGQPQGLLPAQVAQMVSYVLNSVGSI